MKFNDHFNLRNKHALLSGSNYSWLNYDEEKLRDVYIKSQAQVRGTKLHDFARQAIQLGIKLPKTENALNMFINDGIGYRMMPEFIVFYSFNAFGTADCLSFRDNFLRIHDYKSGYTKPSMNQLEIYTGLFCLEYKQDPKDIDIELRIYQGRKIITYNPEFINIKRIMEKIIFFDKKIDEIKNEETSW